MTTSIAPEFHVVFPLWGPVGGVVKILDYLHHTVDVGFERAVAWGPPLPGDKAPIREHAAYRKAQEDPRISFGLLKDLTLPKDAWVLFSEPSQHPDIERALPPGSDRHHVIHLVQNTRHANPSWHLGFPYLLLHRPVTRIFVTNEVAEAVEPVANKRFPAITIVEGHDWPFFSMTSPRDAEGPIRVGYMTWKSTIGDRVADRMAADMNYTFRAIRKPATWVELRELYHSTDVLLCAPGPEEGFYLPGLEAMAASNVVVSAFVGGNKAYLREDENCLRAEFEDVDSHVAALHRLRDEPDLWDRLLTGGHAATERHTLERERNEFAAFIATLNHSD
ncbi:MAG: hypothetical protein HKN94_05380 [Acidimicrobiales bacterium]|nr:hypothetical protein [Acidimicrobiia bacterium]NNC79566.1 hypothetical protein [Acidimicrobiales bacterium]RZV48618.1 MAG: glycosyltransferase family 1 protein [Acidimicrobiales bacterium]